MVENKTFSIIDTSLALDDANKFSDEQITFLYQLFSRDSLREFQSLNADQLRTQDKIEEIINQHFTEEELANDFGLGAKQGDHSAFELFRDARNVLNQHGIPLKKIESINPKGSDTVPEHFIASSSTGFNYQPAIDFLRGAGSLLYRVSAPIMTINNNNHKYLNNRNIQIVGAAALAIGLIGFANENKDTIKQYAETIEHFLIGDQAKVTAEEDFEKSKKGLEEKLPAETTCVDPDNRICYGNGPEGEIIILRYDQDHNLIGLSTLTNGIIAGCSTTTENDAYQTIAQQTLSSDGAFDFTKNHLAKIKESGCEDSGISYTIGDGEYSLTYYPYSNTIKGEDGYKGTLPEYVNLVIDYATLAQAKDINRLVELTYAAHPENKK